MPPLCPVPPHGHTPGGTQPPRQRAVTQAQGMAPPQPGALD